MALDVFHEFLAYMVAGERMVMRWLIGLPMPSDWDLEASD
jgi:hypothetical protein